MLPSHISKPFPTWKGEEGGQEEGNFTQKQQAWKYEIFSPKNKQYHYIDTTDNNIYL